MFKHFKPAWWINLKSLLGLIPYKNRGPKSDHFDGEHFCNQKATPHHSYADFKRWQNERTKSSDWAWRDQRPTQQIPLPKLTNDLVVTYINHATILLQWKDLTVLTDPVWNMRASPSQWIGPKRYHEPGMSIQDLPHVDVILISHNHYDHLDIATLKLLFKRFPDTVIVTALGNEPLIQESGFKHIKGLDWWQAHPIGDAISIHATPAQHWSTRNNRDRNKALWCGFVICHPTGLAFFAGDTGFAGHFHEIHERFGPMRFAALPIGAYEPRWFMKDNHMNPEEAVKAHIALQSQASLGIHFGTFKLTDENQFEPLTDLHSALITYGVDTQQFQTRKPGESWHLK